MKLEVSWESTDGKFWTTKVKKHKGPFRPLASSIFHEEPLILPDRTLPHDDLFIFYPGFILGSRQIPEIEWWRVDYNNPVLFVTGLEKYNEDFPIADIYNPDEVIFSPLGAVAAMAYSVLGYNLFGNDDVDSTILILNEDLYTQIMK